MKIIIKILLIALFFSLIALGLISCGARKVNKSSDKQKIKSEVVDKSVIEKESNTNVKTTTEVKTDDKNETVTEETIYEPADNNKESFVIEKDGTKVILNNAKKIVRNTTQKNNTQNSVNSKTETTENKYEKENKNISLIDEVNNSISKKEVRKEQFNWLSLWWLYLIIIGSGYFLLKRYKII